jgi:ABC-2 type transport system ATP-binding protein
MTAAAAARADGPAGKAKGGVCLQGLVKSYRGPQGSIRAVRGIAVSIAAGETVALLGPNGAGKSTTIDMLLGLARPDGGTVSVFGRSPREAVDAGLVGAMLQTGGLIRDLSVRELVAMMASLYPDPMDVAEALEVTGLTEAAGQRTHKLSGGQTQRVRFALAIVCNPDLLVLDEPTVALDVEGRREFWSIMRGFAARGKTVLFATHYLEEADANADRAVLMAHGRIVADGPTTEIKARVGRRTLRATLPDIDPSSLAGLPGVASAERHGDAVVLSCVDSDLSIRALLERHPAAKDIEIVGGSLEEAFLELTGEPDSGEPDSDEPDSDEQEQEAR